MHLSIVNSKAALLSLLVLKSYALIPVRDASSSSLKVRGLQNIEDVLRPRHGLESRYLHEDFGPGYIISVAHAHNELRYVNLDDLEDFGGSISCSHNAQLGMPSNMKLTFSSPSDVVKARTVWGDSADVVFTTSHPHCDKSKERSFFRPSEIAYSTDDLEDLSVYISGDVRSLADPSMEGESIAVSGGPMTSPYSRIGRRQESLEGEPYYYNGTIDLSNSFTDPRTTLFTSPGFNVTCVDCSLSGQIFPSFSVTIVDDTDALANAAEDPNDLANLIKVVPDASLSAVVTQTINSNITLEINSEEGVEAHCSIPPTDCGVGIIVPGPTEQGITKSILSGAGNPPAITVGAFQIAPRVSFGLRFALDVRAQTTITIPFTSQVPQDNSISFSTDSLPVNNLNATVVPGTPSVSVDSVEACATVAYGPMASLTVTANAGGPVLIALGGEVDAPKIKTCASEANNVDQSCNPNGPIASALALKTDVSAGVTLNAKTLALFDEGTGDFLEPNLYHREDCFDLSQVRNLANGTASGAGGSGRTSPMNSTMPGSNSSAYTPTTTPGAPAAIYTGFATPLKASGSTAMAAIWIVLGTSWFL